MVISVSGIYYLSSQHNVTTQTKIRMNSFPCVNFRIFIESKKANEVPRVVELLQLIPTLHMFRPILSSAGTARAVIRGGGSPAAACAPAYKGS
jgi:hypothetical protein